nr:MAG TPA: hypothetical protein [Caudoviricetes sp.]
MRVHLAKGLVVERSSSLTSRGFAADYPIFNLFTTFTLITRNPILYYYV